MPRLYIQLLLLAAAVIYAMLRGGRSEKSIATILTAMVIIDESYHFFAEAESQWATVDQWHLMLDSFSLCAMFAVVFSTDRLWPFFAAAFQLLTMIGHLARALNVMMPQLVYAILVQALFYLLILTLAFGTWQHHRRQLEIKQHS